MSTRSWLAPWSQDPALSAQSVTSLPSRRSVGGARTARCAAAVLVRGR